MERFVVLLEGLQCYPCFAYGSMDFGQVFFPVIPDQLIRSVKPSEPPSEFVRRNQPGCSVNDWLTEAAV